MNGCLQLKYIDIDSQEIQDEINRIQTGHIDKCIERKIPVRINGEIKVYVCKTCLRHMRKKKLPPMSAMNNLQLTDTDDQIKDEGLDLTELEGALIAKST